jgi:hypothetical protein
LYPTYHEIVAPSSNFNYFSTFHPSFTICIMSGSKNSVTESAAITNTTTSADHVPATTDTVCASDQSAGSTSRNAKRKVTHDDPHASLKRVHRTLKFVAKNVPDAGMCITHPL